MKQVIKVVLQPGVLTAFILGGVIFGIIGWYIPSPITAAKYEGAALRQSSGNYTYIRPLLTCDIASQEVFTDLNPLKSALTKIINAQRTAGKADQVSVYFRDLRDAHWFDINPTDTYAPASLLKVFVMMAYYKDAEDLNDPSILQKQFPYEQSTNPVIEVPGEVIPHLNNHQLYTVNELITQMIVYSDNDALTTLVDNMDASTFQKMQVIFSDLKIPSPIVQGKQITNYMPVDQYATVFRVLHGSTYLSTAYSEKALGLLSQAHFSAALAAGVPAGIAVAHKFGVSPGLENSNPELHDCGIVYFPKHSYLLCVMTRGSDFTSLQNTIKSISAETYAQVTKLYPNGK